MKRYSFEVARHEEFGELGFRPSWYPNGDPLQGMAVAHDILEHFPKDNGQAEGEYMALGASMWIRGVGGLYMNGSPEENIAADLPTVWGVHKYQHKRTSVRPCGVCHESDIMEQARCAVAYWMKEEQYREESERPSAEDCELVARWIAKGYQRARRRYAKQGACSVAWSLFHAIEEQADKCLKYAEEGMILTVLVDFTNLKARVSCDYPESEYGYE